MSDHEHHGGEGRNGLPTKWVLVGFLAIAAYFLLSEHRAHFIQFLPFLLLLACPLLHIFHGHGGRKKDREGEGTGRSDHRSEGDLR